MTVFPSRAVCVFACLIVCGSFLSGQDRMRVWKSAGGNFEIEAAMTGKSFDKVKLKTSDGREIEVEIEKLSVADQAYIRNHINMRGAVGGAGKAKTKPLVSGARTLTRPGIGVWNVPPDVFSNASSSFDGPIRLGDGSPSLTARILSSPDRSMMVYFDRSTQGKSHYEMFDATTGQRIGDRIEHPELTPIDISPSKLTFLALSGSHARQSGMLNVLVFGEKLQPLVSFYPYGERGRLLYTQFVDDDHFLTVSDKGLMGLWNVSTLKLIWKTQVWPGSRPGLSPNRKLLFARVDSGILAMDALSGEGIGLAACDLLGIRQLAVNDSSTRLVGVGLGAARVWDLSNGQLIADFAIPSVVRDPMVQWVNDTQFLAGDNQSIFDLIDIELQCAPWVYITRARTLARGPDNKIWMASIDDKDSTNLQMRSIRIPHPEAEAKINRSSSATVSLFDYGATLPFSIQTSGNRWNVDAAYDAADELFQRKGFTLSKSSGPSGFIGKLPSASSTNSGKAPDSQSSIRLSLVSSGQTVWMPGQDFSMGFGTIPLSENPWQYYVIPKTFRFNNNQLDHSFLTSDIGFKQVEFYREFDEGVGQGYGTRKGSDTGPRGPGRTGPGRTGPGRTGPRRPGGFGRGGNQY